MQGAVEVHTTDGSFVIWYANGRLHGHARLPDNSFEITYWHEIPVASWASVQEAVSQVAPSFGNVFRKNPWETSAFRMSSLNTCSDCPQFAG